MTLVFDLTKKWSTAQPGAIWCPKTFTAPGSLHTGNKQSGKNIQYENGDFSQMFPMQHKANIRLKFPNFAQYLLCGQTKSRLDLIFVLDSPVLSYANNVFHQPINRTGIPFIRWYSPLKTLAQHQTH